MSVSPILDSTFSPLSAPVEPLGDCDFWIGITLKDHRSILPVCSCYKGDWSPPETVPLKRPIAGGDAEIEIPKNWSEGNNPPPLDWEVFCRGKSPMNIKITKLQAYEGGGAGFHFLADHEFPSDCVAISGNLSVKLNQKDGGPLRAVFDIRGHQIFLDTVVGDGSHIRLFEFDEHHQLRPVFVGPILGGD